MRKKLGTKQSTLHSSRTSCEMAGNRAFRKVTICNRDVEDFTNSISQGLDRFNVHQSGQLFGGNLLGTT